MLQRYKVSFDINSIQGFSHIEKDIFSKGGKIYFLGICFQERGRESIITYIIRNSSKSSDFLQDSKTVGNWGGVITFTNSFYQEESKIKQEGTSHVVLYPNNAEVHSFSVKPCLISKDASDIEVLNPSKVDIEKLTEKSGFISSRYLVRNIEYAKLELPILDYIEMEELELDIEDLVSEVELLSNKDLDVSKEEESSVPFEIGKKTKADQESLNLEISDVDVLEGSTTSSEDISLGEESEDLEVDWFNPIEDTLEEEGYTFEDIIQTELGVAKVFVDERGNTVFVREFEHSKDKGGQKEQLKSQGRKEAFSISDEIIRSEGELKLIRNSFGNYQIVDKRGVVKSLSEAEGDSLSRNNVVKLKSYL